MLDFFVKYYELAIRISIYDFLEQIIVKGEFLKFIRGRVYVRKEKYKIKKRKIL